MRQKRADPMGVNDQLELIMLRDRLDSQQRVGVAQICWRGCCPVRNWTP